MVATSTAANSSGAGKSVHSNGVGIDEGSKGAHSNSRKDHGVDGTFLDDLKVVFLLQDGSVHPDRSKDNVQAVRELQSDFARRAGYHEAGVFLGSALVNEHWRDVSM